MSSARVSSASWKSGIVGNACATPREIGIETKTQNEYFHFIHNKMTFLLTQSIGIRATKHCHSRLFRQSIRNSTTFGGLRFVRRCECSFSTHNEQYFFLLYLFGKSDFKRYTSIRLKCSIDNVFARMTTTHSRIQCENNRSLLPNVIVTEWEDKDNDNYYHLFYAFGKCVLQVKSCMIHKWNTFSLATAHQIKCTINWRQILRVKFAN